jgi:hypothetical protein
VQCGESAWSVCSSFRAPSFLLASSVASADRPVGREPRGAARSRDTRVRRKALLVRHAARRGARCLAALLCDDADACARALLVCMLACRRRALACAARWSPRRAPLRRLAARPRAGACRRRRAAAPRRRRARIPPPRRRRQMLPAPLSRPPALRLCAPTPRFRLRRAVLRLNRRRVAAPRASARRTARLAPPLPPPSPLSPPWRALATSLLRRRSASTRAFTGAPLPRLAAHPAARRGAPRGARRAPASHK